MANLTSQEVSLVAEDSGNYQSIQSFLSVMARLSNGHLSMTHLLDRINYLELHKTYASAVAASQNTSATK